MSGGRGGLTYNKRLGTEDFHRHGFCMDKEDLGLAVRIKTTRLTSTEEDLDHQVSRYLSFWSSIIFLSTPLPLRRHIRPRTDAERRRRLSESQGATVDLEGGPAGTPEDEDDRRRGAPPGRRDGPPTGPGERPAGGPSFCGGTPSFCRHGRRSNVGRRKAETS